VSGIEGKRGKQGGSEGKRSEWGSKINQEGSE